jgi:type VI protein secretion system component VasK
MPLRRLRKNTGIRAQKLTIRTHVPRHWYAMGAVVALALVSVLVWLGLNLSDRPSKSDMESLQGKLKVMESELAQHRTQAQTEMSDKLIASSTQQQLLEKIKVLETENSRLKEDLGLMQRLGARAKR